MHSLPGYKSGAWAGAALVFCLSGCTPTPETIIVIDSINAINEDGEPVGDLFSDVCVGDPPGCVVVNDNAVVVMSARAKDPFTDVAKFGDIIIDRYRVSYVRADGRNVPGIEVPYTFDGVINFRVPVNALASQPFMVVRPQAKLEPPLKNLAQGGGAIAISVIAQIDFYGKDLNDRGVAAHGFLNITFADFGNR